MDRKYSVISLRTTYGEEYFYKDYSGRTPQKIADDWREKETLQSFAGPDHTRISGADFAYMEQMITEQEAARREGLEQLDDENLLFSATLDVNDGITVHSRGGDTHIDFEKALEEGKLEFGEFEPSSQLMPVRVFIDMDGVLAKFNQVDTLEVLYEQGYFLNLEPQIEVVEAVRQLTLKPDVEVYILSSVLSDSAYALQEKNAWLDRYLPEIDTSHRIFPPCGEDKKQYIPLGVRETDCLLDDYTQNLSRWEPPAKGIKLLNGINHTHGTWKGAMVFHDMPADEITSILSMIIGNIKKQAQAQKEQQEFHSNVRRYDSDGNRLFRGKRPEDFTKEDLLEFYCDTDMLINGHKLSDEMAKILEQEGYEYDEIYGLKPVDAGGIKR